jgi:hypothetical protein
MAITREDIAAAVKQEREDIAEALLDRTSSDIERVEAPSLSRYRIYALTVYGEHAPGLHYLGFAEDGRGFVLSEDLAAFETMVDEDGGVELTSAAEAEAFVELLLTVTRPLSKLSYLVKGIDDLDFRPNLDKAEKAEKARIEGKYADVLRPPAAKKSGDGFEVTAFRVVDQDLQRVRVKVTRAGKAEVSVTTLERDLPLVIGA